MKKTLVFLLSLALMASLIGCGGSAGPDSGVKLNHELAVTFPDSEADKIPYSVTVNYAVDGWTYPETSSAATRSPGEGKKLLLLNLTVKAGDSDVTVGGRDFGVWYDKTSYANWYADVDSIPNPFPEGVVVPAGEEFTGDIMFEVMADYDLSKFELDVYRSNIGRGEEMEITLGDMM
ncbi:MAG: hypothetical protein Q8P68_02995 [Candidatus Peregrinibacteria bacterium]|nr:hypothetical protein [Candidatus Peregrinibacteria bacterium]MDZ4244700.1 hypothetical protein [Candidatus Gracilibacteria bacterium]